MRASGSEHPTINGRSSCGRRNLTDKYYYQVAFDAPYQYGQIDSFLGAPRTFGVTARVKF